MECLSQVVTFNRTLYSFLIKLLGSELNPAGYVAPPMSKLRVGFFIIRSLIWLILAFYGFSLLIRDGFLDQNIIYLLLS
jgi:hypothetical protein